MFFFAGHLAQQALGILIDVHETGDDPDDQEDQLQPGTRLQPGVESVAYGETHQRAAHHMHADGARGDKGFHALALLFENVLQ